MSDPEGLPGKTSSIRRGGRSETLGREARCRASDLEAGATYFPWLDGVHGETLAVVGGGRFPFSCAGKIKLSRLRQAQGIAELGAQQERRDSLPLVGPHHVLERWVRASRHITGQNQPSARSSANCKAPLTADHFPPGRGLGNSLANSAGWGGHSERHKTHGCGSVCPHARRSARSSMQLACANSP